MELINFSIRQLIQNKLVSQHPNLSLMLPGPCNAHCNFCFWDRTQAGNKNPGNEYLNRVEAILDSLPSEFNQISLTGGEPTISPVFDKVIDLIKSRKNKFTKLVLTTNGAKLQNKKEIISGVVDHINISRHHYDDSLNQKIFQTPTIPTTEKLHSIISDNYGNADICFNCVVPDKVSAKFCESFIDYAKKFTTIAATNFRIQHNTMDDCKAQTIFESKYGPAYVSNCPVCKVAYQKVRGMDINWKYSVLEPIQNWDGIFELVVQPDGSLTADWEGLCIINPKLIEPYEKSIEEKIFELEKVL